MTDPVRQEQLQDRWDARLDRVHAQGERPTGPPPTKEPEDLRTMNRHATDTATPRLLEDLDRAIDDLVEFRKHAERAMGRLSDAMPGYPTAPGSGVARPIDVVLEDRNGIVAWSCSARRCAHDTAARGTAARGTAMNDVDARRAFLAHQAEEHAVDPATQPERGALGGGDDAIRDLRDLRIAARRIRFASRRGRDISTKWGVTRVGAKVDAPLDAGWCTSCKRANHFSTRRPEGGEVCRWCADKLLAVNAVRAERDAAPLTVLPVEAIETYARGANVHVRDIERWAAGSDEPASPRLPRGRRSKYAS